MRVLRELVFDEPMEGNANYYTTTDWNDALGSPDRLWLFVVVSQVVGPTATLTVQVEHSPNGIDWLPLSGPGNPAEIDRVTISTSVKTFLTSNVVTNAQGLVRLRAALANLGDKARVQIFVTARNEA